jgi:hypothetical protein
MDQSTMKVERRIKLWIAQQEYDRRRAGGQSGSAQEATARRTVELRKA